MEHIEDIHNLVVKNIYTLKYYLTTPSLFCSLEVNRLPNHQSFHLI